jgi:hypothetical protein
MSQGYLIHAYNNQEIDYGTMALCAALLIKKNCAINNVCLVTTKDTLTYLKQTHSAPLLQKAFDNIQVVKIDRDVKDRKYFDTRYAFKTQPYFNSNRPDSFDLTPFDETILLDADYLMLDNSFDSVWNGTEDILINKAVKDLHHKHDQNGFDTRFNEMSIPLYWATAIYFKKNSRAQSLFNLVKFVKDNYRYYENLYQFFPNKYYRNDYALSIAIHMISGQFEQDSIKPFPVPYILVSTEYDELLDFKNNTAFFVGEKDQGNFSLHQIRTNVHVMNKWSIGRNAEKIITYATK